MTDTIAIGSDHAGFDLKQALKTELQKQGFAVEDFGANGSESVDYPDFAIPVAKAVGSGKFARGVVVCGSGQGVAMAANKIPGVRAALCRTVEDAQLSRAHNDANILALGGRVTNLSDSIKILQTFLSTPFEGGRHATRVEKLNKASC